MDKWPDAERQKGKPKKKENQIVFIGLFPSFVSVVRSYYTESSLFFNITVVLKIILLTLRTKTILALNMKMNFIKIHK